MRLQNECLTWFKPSWNGALIAHARFGTATWIDHNRSNIKEGFSMGSCASHCFTFGDLDLLGWGHGGSMFGRSLVASLCHKKDQGSGFIYIYHIIYIIYIYNIYIYHMDIIYIEIYRDIISHDIPSRSPAYTRPYLFCLGPGQQIFTVRWRCHWSCQCRL